MPRTAKVDTTETIIEQAEALLAKMPASYRETNERHSFAEGQLRSTRENLKSAQREANAKHPGPSRAKSEAEVTRLTQAIGELEAAPLPEFNASARRNAGLALVAMEAELVQANTAVHDKWSPLVDYAAKGALSGAEYDEKVRLEGLRNRLNTTIKTIEDMRSELYDLVPDAVKAERTALLGLVKAIENAPDSGVAGMVAEHVKRWASDQLAALSGAVLTQNWADLERFEVAPLQ